MGLTYFKRYRMEIDVVERHAVRPTLPESYSLVPWEPALLEDQQRGRKSIPGLKNDFRPYTVALFAIWAVLAWGTDLGAKKRTPYPGCNE